MVERLAWYKSTIEVLGLSISQQYRITKQFRSKLNGGFPRPLAKCKHPRVRNPCPFMFIGA